MRGRPLYRKSCLQWSLRERVSGHGGYTVQRDFKRTLRAERTSVVCSNAGGSMDTVVRGHPRQAAFTM